VYIYIVNIVNRTQIEQGERNAAAWQVQWRDALEMSAGVAPYLEKGVDYVENVRRADAERLSLESPI
jgi:hypothetical protein